MNIQKFNTKLSNGFREFVEANHAHPDLEKSLNFLMLHYLIKGYKLLKGINILCSEGHYSNSEILLRSLFEDYCLSAYITDNPNDITRIEDCVMRTFFAEKKQMDELDGLAITQIENVDEEDIKQEFLAKSETINEATKIRILDYNKTLSRFKKRPEYNNLSEKKMLGKIDNKISTYTIIKFLNKKYETSIGLNKDLIKKYYATVFRGCALSVHCNDIRDHLRRNDDGSYELFLEDKGKMRNLIFITSANLFIQIMQMTNDTLKFNKDLLLQELNKEYEAIVNSNIIENSGGHDT